MSSSRIPCPCLQVISAQTGIWLHQMSSVAAGEECWNNVVWDFCPATVTAAKQRPILPVVEWELEPHGSALHLEDLGCLLPKHVRP